MDPGSLRNEEVQKNDCKMMHLPNELLECILLKFKYAEVAKVGQVCRRFRDVGDEILKKKFRSLKTCVESHLATVVQEENAFLGKPVPSGMGSTRRGESDMAVPKLPPRRDPLKLFCFHEYFGPRPQRDQFKLIRSRRLLKVICSQIHLMRALCYRRFFLKKNSRKIRYSTASFIGELIDVVHYILRLVKSKKLKNAEKTYLYVFQPLVHKSKLLLNRIEAHLIKHICAYNKSECSYLFCSKVIDILKCILDCRKDIAVNTSRDWCYIKGQYQVNGTLMNGLPGGAPGLEPLSVYQQLDLHNRLYDLARWSNNYYLWRERHYEEFDIDFCRGLTELDFALCWSDRSYQKFYGKLWEEKVHIIFKVDLKCRKELAPIELLHELVKEQPYDYTEDKNAPGANATEDFSPDFELKLQIHWRPHLSIRGIVVHEYLVQQRHTDR
jgi:hypothetical protein